MLAKLCLLLAGLFGGSAVLLGALEAHMLRPELRDSATAVDPDRRLENAETAVRYQMIHAAALLGAGLLALQRKHFLICASCITLALGMLLFCGALHVHAYTGNTDILKAAPYGGMLLIISWLALGCGGMLGKPRTPDSPNCANIPAGDGRK